MTRWLFTLLTTVSLSASAWAAPRIAVVQSDDLSYYTEPVDAFLNSFDEPVTVINIRGRHSVAETAVKRLKDDPPEVLFCLGAKAAFAMKHLMPRTPIVYASVLAPTRFGITGHNIAGVAMTVPPAATISQYVSFFDGTKRIGVIRGPNISNQRIEALESAADRSKIELVTERARSPKNVVPIIHKLARHVDAIWLQADRAIISPRIFRRLVDETRNRQIGLIVESEAMVKAGALFAVVPSHNGVGKQAASVVQRILDGENPGGIGVESPTDAKVVLNLKTLRNSNLEFDRLLLDFVDIKVDD